MQSTQITWGKHGDFLRYLGGAGSASQQMEYVNKYGSAEPVVSDQ